MSLGFGQLCRVSGIIIIVPSALLEASKRSCAVALLQMLRPMWATSGNVNKGRSDRRTGAAVRGFSLSRASSEEHRVFLDGFPSGFRAGVCIFYEGIHAHNSCPLHVGRLGQDPLGPWSLTSSKRANPTEDTGCGSRRLAATRASIDIGIFVGTLALPTPRSNKPSLGV